MSVINKVESPEQLVDLLISGKNEEKLLALFYFDEYVSSKGIENTPFSTNSIYFSSLFGLTYNGVKEIQLLSLRLINNFFEKLPLDKFAKLNEKGHLLALLESNYQEISEQASLFITLCSKEQNCFFIHEDFVLFVESTARVFRTTTNRSVILNCLSALNNFSAVMMRLRADKRTFLTVQLCYMVECNSDISINVQISDLLVKLTANSPDCINVVTKETLAMLIERSECIFK